MKDVREIIKGINDLTPVPHTVNQLLATAQDPRSSLHDTAALLKDIGKLVLSRYVASSLDDIRHLVFNKHMSFIEAGKAVLGITHVEVGGLIAENWHFPEKMVHIIRNHHLLEPSTRRDMETAMVYLAGAICIKTGSCVASDGAAYAHYDQILRYLHLDATDVAHVVRIFQDDKGKIDALVHMV